MSLNNSSAGHDELPPSVAKSCTDGYIEPLAHLINKSLRTGICPSKLKIARVVPIFKSGDPPMFTNYRSISTLSFLSFLVVFFSKKNYLLLSYTTPVHPSVRPSVFLSVCPSVSIISFYGNLISSKPIHLKIGLSVP